MSVGLNALVDIPAQAEPMEKIVNSSESDVGVVINPRSSDEEQQKREDREHCDIAPGILWRLWRHHRCLFLAKDSQVSQAVVTVTAAWKHPNFVECQMR